MTGLTPAAQIFGRDVALPSCRAAQRLGRRKRSLSNVAAPLPPASPAVLLAYGFPGGWMPDGPPCAPQVGFRKSEFAPSLCDSAAR